MHISSKLLSLLASTALFMAVGGPAAARENPAENLQTRLVVKQGQDILVRLNYAGGVKGWDAAFGHHGKIVTLINSGFITILDPDGDIATPREGKLIRSWVKIPMKDAFDIVINLADIYDMSTPGRYIIEWGCKNVRSQMIQIDVIGESSCGDGPGAESSSQEDMLTPPAQVLPKFN